MAKGIAEATTKIYEQLEGLESGERLRAVKAALMMLGEEGDGLPGESVPAKVAKMQKETSTSEEYSEKANAWIKKNGIQPSELEELFHLDGGKVQLILGKAVGTSKRQQTVNTYILTGVAAFLEKGVPEFTDDDARKYCQHLACYDSPNHHNYVKAFGNKITGTKSAGWKLTAPGLAEAVKIIHPEQESHI